MSTNMELITSVTVGAGGVSSVTIPATGTIPATYTDLVLKVSARNNTAAVDSLFIRPNNSSSNLTTRWIQGDITTGSTTTTSENYPFVLVRANGNNSAAGSFCNSEVYIPNYASTTMYKSIYADSTTEANGQRILTQMTAGLWASNTAITSLVLVPETGGALIMEGSTFYLYGVSNVTSTTKATGGIVSSDGNYNYHMFPFSGTFTPTESITADILVIAGGGGAGTYNYGGGGGAGGLRGFTSQSLTTTPYTISVGGGGAPGTSGGLRGSNGENSSVAGSGFSTITASGGGGGGGDNNTSSGTAIGASGGSGGGNYIQATGAGGAGNAGSYSPSEGNNGGSGAGNPGTSTFGAGGGGGAGGVANTTFGYGGIGSSVYSSWANATQTGVNGYYAGGGGGGAAGGVSSGNGKNLGGAGGGGDSGIYNSISPAAQAGKANTGGGGGGGGAGTSAAGGSGLVIIRYAI